MRRAMFELGASLRDARRKRGLELDAVQRATRIRRRYLEAMEEERFELLPGVAYARGFLREYAEFLGLDGSLYVQEYNERFAPREESQPISPRRSSLPPPRFSPGGLALPALLVAAAVAVGLAAWKLTGGGTTSAAPPSRPAATTTVHRKTARKPVRTATRPAAPASLVLTASRGDSWMSVHVGSESGATVYEGTLHQGSTIRFGLRHPLWIRFGAGSNVDATVGKRKLELPQLVGDVLVPKR